MKHIFILNPAAGNGSGLKLLPKIVEAAKNTNIDYEIHRTVSAGDARNFVASFVGSPKHKQDSEVVRFYACGGDGTANEVLNGIIDARNVELAAVPAGTGNDFIRNFDNPALFADIECLIKAKARPVDALKYEISDGDFSHTETVDEIGTESHAKWFLTGYALNMINFGFDAEVVAKTAEIKSGLLKGSAAYIAGVLIILAKLRKLAMDVELDTGEHFTGDFLLAGAANGGYSGGGFKGLPGAKIDDGLMDVLTVKSISRRFFLSIVKKYHDGTHVGEPRLEGILSAIKCKSAIFRPEKSMIAAIDGETVEISNIKVGIVPGAVNFVVPG